MIQVANAKTITQAFERIPGVKTVSSAVQIKLVSIPVRFYFEPNSSVLISKDLENKLDDVKIFINQYLTQYLKLIGYSYSPNVTSATKNLGIQRATSVRQKLI